MIDNSDIIFLREKVARLEEKLFASEKALDLARDDLRVSANSGQDLEIRLRILEQNVKIDAGKHSAFSTVWVISIAVISIIISLVALIIKFKGGAE